MQTLPTILLLLAVLGGPLLAAWIIGRLIRMPDYTWKIWLVLFSAVVGLLPVALRGSDALKLGVDLSGGTILVYQVDPNQIPPEGFDMDKMVGAITQRINPSGTVDVTVRPSGHDRIEIIIPRATDEEVRRYKDIITNLGSLEFRILANEKDQASLIRRGELSFPRPVVRDVTFDAAASYAERLDQGEIPDDLREQFANHTMDLSDEAKVTPGERDGTAGWKVADRGRQYFIEKHDDRLVVHGQRVEAEWIPIAKSQLADFSRHGQVALRTDPELGLMALTVRERPRDEVTGQFLRRAMRGMDPSGRPNVEFRFDSEGARRFGRLTRENTPDRDGFQRRLAIVLSGKIYSAPNIRSEINDRGEITGDFTVTQVDDLVRVLNAGSLPAALDVNPVMENTIGPTLGRDTIDKGTTAMIVSMIAVLLFMVAYYLYFAGTVADVCLVLNLILVVGIMSLINATFTLPGLAGLVLTVGMSVDANVLIFERIREERDRGGALRVAIRNGFGRASRTIVDANITTLLTAAVLFGIGTDQVKGFAVALIIGILSSLFTAMFVSRVIFEIFERKGWIRGVRMLRVVSNTRVDFLGKAAACLTVSGVLIVVGMVAVAARGTGLLDIDFTGGTAVAIRLNEPESTEEVRQLASVIPDVTVEDLTVGEERPAGGKFDRFLIRTTEQDPTQVKGEIIKAFGSRLVHVEMTYGEIESIPAAPPAEAKRTGDANDAEAKNAEAETKPEAKTEPKSETKSEVEAAGSSADGANPSRFAGGTRVALDFSQPVAPAAIKGLFADYFGRTENLANAELQIAVMGTERSGEGENQSTAMTLETAFNRDQVGSALTAIKTRLSDEPLFDRINNFGAQVAGETKELALIAMLASLVAIIGYIWIRFQAVTFGLAAVAALVHDVLVVLGLVALSSWLTSGPAGALGRLMLLDPFKIDLAMIAAFLTLVGYSLNDTIVIFDRIREVRGKSPEITKEIVNASVNQSLSRTLLTSWTTLLVVVILYIWGGEGIHGFAFCLVTGIIVGTYSSIYIASPILIWLNNRRKPRHAGRARTQSRARQRVAETT